MAIHEILKMGDPRLLRLAQPVPRFNTPELLALVRDMKETMAHVNGAGLARAASIRATPTPSPSPKPC